MVGMLALIVLGGCMFLKSVLDMERMVWVEGLSWFGLCLGLVCSERKG